MCQRASRALSSLNTGAFTRAQPRIPVGKDKKIYTAAPDRYYTADMRWGGHGWVGWLLLLALFALYYVVYFAPVLVRGGILAPGDGEVYYLSYFNLPILQFWNDSILSGFPVIADIQAQTLYPLRWLSPSYNVLVLAAYVVAAVGMFGLALSQTGSRLAALFAAFVFSGSGFMMGHLGHLGIIHSAAWVPAILWALATLSKAPSWRAVGCGAMAVAMCVLGGHPQISVIGLLFAGAFAVVELAITMATRGSRDMLRLLVRIFLLFLIGLMMASPTLLGTLKSAVAGMRGNWSVGEFNSFSHDWSSLRMALLPHLYGAHPDGPFGGYKGPFNITELALYAGLLPWMLACFAFPLFGRARVVFWAVCALISLLLCVGTLTPLGRLLYELPMLGRFRAQARFGYLGILCLAMLSAYGMSGLLSNRLSRQTKVVTILALAALLAGAVVWLGGGLSEPRAQGWSTGLKVSAAFGAISLLGVVLLVRRGTHVLSLTLTAIVALDLASFGWFYEWRYASPSSTPLTSDAALIVDTIKSGGGRLLPLGAERWGPNPLRPNINMRYELPSVAGYGPLLSARYAGATGADTVGGFPRLPVDAPLLDVLGVRWMAGELQDTQPVLIGAGCGVNTGLDSVKATLPPDVPLRAVRVVSHMSCSNSTPTGHPIARIEFAGADETPLRHVIAAGNGTGEWAWDRVDVRASIAHVRSHVVDTFEAEGGLRGLWFDSTLDVPDGPSRSQSITVSLMEDNAVPFKIRSIEYQDDSGAWHPVPIGLGTGGDTQRLGKPFSATGLPVVHQRLDYFGIAWSVCKARYVSLQDMGELLRSRDELNARSTALVEQPLQLGDVCRQPPQISIQEHRAGYWRVLSNGDGASLLVLSNAYADGWRAEIDGIPAQVLPLYGVVLGVVVPKGAHEVTVSYRPRWLAIALALAAMAALATLLMLVRGYTRPYSGPKISNDRDKV